MYNNYKQQQTTTFKNPKELMNIARTLDRAEERPLLTTNPSDPKELIPIPTHRVIWNTDNNKLSTVATEQYSIVQHQEAFVPLATALQAFGLPITGWVRNERDRVTAFIKFDTKTVSDDQEGINLGIKIVNTYDGTHALQGELWAYRMACSNGMVLGKVIPNTTYYQVHRGSFDVVKEMEKFIRTAIEKSDVLQGLVSESIKKTMEWEYIELLLPKLERTNKWRVRIEDELRRVREEKLGKPLTRWDVYNAFTSVATHGERIGSIVESRIQQSAQKLLSGDLPTHEALLLEVETPSN